MESLLFYVLGALALAGGLFVVLARNPLYGALGLIGSFFALAGIYAVLGAHLLAALQVLVYAGAVMVLFVFVIMLLNLRDEELGAPRITLAKVGAAAALAVGGVVLIAKVLWKLPGGAAGQVVPVQDLAASPGFGTVREVGRAMFGPWLLPFEMTSLLLLVAIVAAVVAARSRL